MSYDLTGNILARVMRHERKYGDGISVGALRNRVRTFDLRGITLESVLDSLAESRVAAVVETRKGAIGRPSLKVHTALTMPESLRQEDLDEYSLNIKAHEILAMMRLNQKNMPIDHEGLHMLANSSEPTIIPDDDFAMRIVVLLEGGLIEMTEVPQDGAGDMVYYSPTQQPEWTP